MKWVWKRNVFASRFSITSQYQIFKWSHWPYFDVIKNRNHFYGYDHGSGGFNKQSDEFGVAYRCLVNEPANLWRSLQKYYCSMGMVEHVHELGPKLFVFETLQLLSLKSWYVVEEGIPSPWCCYWCLVGFVGAANQNRSFHESPIPSIVALEAREEVRRSSSGQCHPLPAESVGWLL